MRNVFQYFVPPILLSEPQNITSVQAKYPLNFLYQFEKGHSTILLQLKNDQMVILEGYLWNYENFSPIICPSYSFVRTSQYYHCSRKVSPQLALPILKRSFHHIASVQKRPNSDSGGLSLKLWEFVSNTLPLLFFCQNLTILPLYHLSLLYQFKQSLSPYSIILLLLKNEPIVQTWK